MRGEHRTAFIQRWAHELSDHLKRPEKQLVAEGLTADDFSGSVSLDFEDGSRLHFRYAFAVRSLVDAEYVAVFTEHTGYHEFWVGPDDSLTVQ
jgi:hypothetical protein